MRILLTVAASIAFQCSALAQSPRSPLMAAMQALEGTTSATYLPQFAGGKLTACLIEFAALVRDNTSRVGQYSRIGGSFGFMSANGTVAPVMKIIVHDVNASTGDLTPSAPSAAYVAQGAGTNVHEVAGTSPSDTPGGIFIVFQPKETIGLFIGALGDQKIKFLFNRTGKGMDIPVNLDLRVEDTNANGERRRSDRASTEMMTCIRALVKAAGN